MLTQIETILIRFKTLGSIRATDETWFNTTVARKATLSVWADPFVLAVSPTLSTLPGSESRDFGPMRAMFDQVVPPAGPVADPTSALDRFGLRPSMPSDFGVDVARIVGIDQPTRPTATPPIGPSVPEVFGASVNRPGWDAPGLGRYGCSLRAARRVAARANARIG